MSKKRDSSKRPTDRKPSLGGNLVWSLLAACVACLFALSLISAAGIELQDIALRRPSLDEVFLQLTGRQEADAAVDVGALT